MTARLQTLSASSEQKVSWDANEYYTTCNIWNDVHDHVILLHVNFSWPKSFAWIVLINLCNWQKQRVLVAQWSIFKMKEIVVQPLISLIVFSGNSSAVKDHQTFKLKQAPKNFNLSIFQCIWNKNCPLVLLTYRSRDALHLASSIAADIWWLVSNDVNVLSGILSHKQES